MGHAQSQEDLNLGLGWVYYGLARTMRPKTVVVVGSYRGFVPMVLGRALADNESDGRVHLIDPSLVDDFWKDSLAVRKHFEEHGLGNISHHLMTTQEFAQSAEMRDLPSVDIVFVDGLHTKEQAQFDFDTFRSKLTSDGIFLFHDSIRERPSQIYGTPYTHTTVQFMASLKDDPTVQVLDLPFGDGLTLVRPI